MLMKPKTQLILAFLVAGAALWPAAAQGFNNGSNGSLGALEVADTDLTVDLPADGRLHYTTVTVASGRTLRFNRNPLNTPVYLLAQGDVIVNGTINVSGGQAPGNPPIGGAAGPGGFDGGKPGFGAEFPPGDGYGPGAGGAGTTGSDGGSAGGAGHGQPGGGGSSNFKGGTYGSPLLIPPVGGSGGGGDTGSPGNGGGGGGGGILISSNTKIRISGAVSAQGGIWRGTSHNGGSGGAVRLLAPRVEGQGSVNVNGGGSGGGDGRIRIDCLDKTALQLGFQGLATVGANMFVEPSVVPRLDIVEAAGQQIQVGTGNPVRFQLPFGSETNRTIKVQAKDFGANVPILLTLTPDSGRRISIETNINNTVSNPANVVIPVGLPANTLITVHAWTR